MIAACFIGGASASGGVGKVMGVVIGAFVMGVMNNGMSILGSASTGSRSSRASCCSPPSTSTSTRRTKADDSSLLRGSRCWAGRKAWAAFPARAACISMELGSIAALVERGGQRR